jgi:hypothetical protein
MARKYHVLALCLALVPAVAHATGGAPPTTVQASPDDRRLGCFREVTQPAEYRVEQHLVTPAQQYYFRRANGVIELRETPAVYHEERILVREARVVMQEIACTN